MTSNTSHWNSLYFHQILLSFHCHITWSVAHLIHAQKMEETFKPCLLGTKEGAITQLQSKLSIDVEHYKTIYYYPLQRHTNSFFQSK